jgi:hypothetical protein
MASKLGHVIDRDLGWRKILEAARAAAGSSYAKVGVLADDEKGGLHRDGAKLSVAEIAVVLEYGTEDGHIPARSFVRATIDLLRDELIATSARLLVQVVLDRSMSVERALNILGLRGVTAIKQRITSGDGIPPPNAPSTIRAKGSSRPLVDTGLLLSAITWAVITPRSARKPAA